MLLDDSFSLQGVTYQLQAAVFHHGDSPERGHYVAAARHGSGATPFFVYNDQLRKALPGPLTITMELPGIWSEMTFYASLLLYEKVFSTRSV